MIDNEKDIHSEFIHRNTFTPKLVSLPFSQDLKRSVVVRKTPSDPTHARVYVKGAPEYIFMLCNTVLNNHCEKIDFPDQKKESVLSQTIA